MFPKEKEVSTARSSNLPQCSNQATFPGVNSVSVFSKECESCVPYIFPPSTVDGKGHQKAPVKGMEIFRQAGGWQDETQIMPLVVPCKCHENNEALG